MAVSQNGYPANDPSVLTVIRPVPTRAFRVRSGAVATVLGYVIREFDKRVEDIEPGELDDWSYNERPVRGGEDLSNHASGTAVDLDAVRHPLGTAPRGSFSEAQVNTIYAILNEVGGVVRWGGSYTGRQDPMHFEINAPESRVAAVAAKLGHLAPVDTEFTVSQVDDITRALADVRAVLDLIYRGDKAPAGVNELNDGTDTHESVVSVARRVIELSRDVAALSDKVAAIHAGPAGAVDVDTLVTKLADLLAKRLAA